MATTRDRTGRVTGQTGRLTGQTDATPARVLLHIDDGLKEALEPGDVYFVEARDEDCIVRLRSKTAKHDQRPLDEIDPIFSRYGFVRVHRSFLVNVARIRFVRRRTDRDWEVQLDPPVNAIIPLSREGYRRLMELFR